MTAADRPRSWNSTLPVRSGPMPRTPFKSRPREAKVTGTLTPFRTRSQRAGRGESFPPGVAALIDARDPWCVHCGSPRDLQRHHRRIKGHGGDPRPHTDCACNGVRICLACHDWAHRAGRREAEAEGLIVPRVTAFPGSESVLVHTKDGGIEMWPACDGRWLDCAPEVAA